MKFYRINLAALAILFVFSTAFGQSRKPISPEEQSQYLVSIKAGAINFAEGDVSFKRDETGWGTLIMGDDLRDGDVVKTGADGHVEILLNPGSYLRLSENTELVFTDTALDALNLKLVRGAAIVEASVVEEPIAVVTSGAEYSIQEKGLYRINVNQDGSSEIFVRNGKVMVAGTKVKKGKKALIAGSTPVVTKFDKKEETTFDLWSKDRARTLIAANKQLSNRRLKSTLANSNVLGMWLYDPVMGFCTFLPGYGGFSSPYGWGYSRYNPYWYNYGWGYSGGYYNGGSSSGGQNTGTGGGTASNPGTGTGGGHKGGHKGGGAAGPPRLPNPGRGRDFGGAPSIPRTEMPAPSSGGGKGHRHGN